MAKVKIESKHKESDQKQNASIIHSWGTKTGHILHSTIKIISSKMRGLLRNKQSHLKLTLSQYPFFFGKLHKDSRSNWLSTLILGSIIELYILAKFKFLILSVEIAWITLRLPYKLATWKLNPLCAYSFQKYFNNSVTWSHSHHINYRSCTSHIQRWTNLKTYPMRKAKQFHTNDNYSTLQNLYKIKLFLPSDSKTIFSFAVVFAMASQTLTVLSHPVDTNIVLPGSFENSKLVTGPVWPAKTCNQKK